MQSNPVGTGPGRLGQVDTGPSNPNEPTWTAGFNPYTGQGYYNPFAGWFSFWQDGGGGGGGGPVLGPDAAYADGVAKLGLAEYTRIGNQLASCCVDAGAGYIGGGQGQLSPGATVFQQMGSGSPPATPPAQPGQAPDATPGGTPPESGQGGTTGPPATRAGIGRSLRGSKEPQMTATRARWRPAQRQSATVYTMQGVGVGMFAWIFSPCRSILSLETEYSYYGSASATVLRQGASRIDYH